MKRLSSSDCSSALISICSQPDEQSPRNSNLYGREFQSMLEGFEEEGCVEEVGYHSEKKRRLSVEQVKGLEKNFEVENKLEPETKVKLAQELGLQPRQVAVWFQNRRARWKTKQLERDYGVLKANYEALKVNFDALHQDNEALHKQIEELKSRLEEENTGSRVSVKEEEATMELGSKSDPSHETSTIPGTESNKDHLNKYDGYHNAISDGVGAVTLFSLDTKDGSSDSDTSAILNEDNHQHLLFSPEEDSSNSPNSSLINCFQFQKLQYVKMEEHNFLSADEACNFFNDEQAPTLQWYSQDQWN